VKDKNKRMEEEKLPVEIKRIETKKALARRELSH